MSLRLVRRFVLSACAIVGAAFFSVCHGGAKHAAAKQLPMGGTKPTSAPSLPPGVQADEIGRIPILMYHSVGDPPLTGKMARFNKLGLSIPASLLRKHLQMMLDAGFYPVNVRDVCRPDLSIPAGKTPVALTFDDARGSQFRYLKNGTIDPNCVVGILEAFHAKNGDKWPRKASFYVLPASKYNPVPFWQAGMDKKKFQFLASSGYEIANHSTSHRPFSRLNAQTLEWEMTTCQKYVQERAPNATMDTMALPYGITPASHALYEVVKGNAHTPYHNKCILLAAGDAAYSPLDKRYNALRVMRIGSEPGNIERWITALKAYRKKPSSTGMRTYVSDGNPETLTIPQSQSKWLVASRLTGVKVVAYADAPPPKKTSPTKTAKQRPVSARVAQTGKKAKL